MTVPIDWTKIVGAKTTDDGGYAGDLMELALAHLSGARDRNQLTDDQVGEVYASVINTAINAAIGYELKVAATEASTNELVLNGVQDRLLKDEQRAQMVQDLLEDVEKWNIQKQMLENQNEMSAFDLQYKQDQLIKDLATKDKQIEAMQADIDFNVSKEAIMVLTRKDNIRMKSAEQFAEFMKYISAANVIPGATDFTNMRDLINAIGTGLTLPDTVGTVAATTVNFTKP
jgi:hypothetical protein